MLANGKQCLVGGRVLRGRGGRQGAADEFTNAGRAIAEHGNVCGKTKRGEKAHSTRLVIGEQRVRDHGTGGDGRLRCGRHSRIMGAGGEGRGGEKRAAELAQNVDRARLQRYANGVV